MEGCRGVRRMSLLSSEEFDREHNCRHEICPYEISDFTTVSVSVSQFGIQIFSEPSPKPEIIPFLLEWYRINWRDFCLLRVTQGTCALADWVPWIEVGSERSEVGFLFSTYKFEGRIGFLMELQAEFQDSAQKTTAQSRADIGNEREFGFSFECTRTHNFTRFCAPWWQLNCWRSFSLQHCLQPHAKQN